MRAERRIVRDFLRTAAPCYAVPLIDRFGLGPEERACLVECDVRRRSTVSVGRTLGMAPGTVSRYRGAAMDRIAAALLAE